MENDHLVREFLLSLPHQKRRGDDRPMFLQQGFWISSHFHEGVNATMEHFKPLPTDIILVSFPKTGTTWLKALVYSIVHRSSSKHQLTTKHVQHLVPFLEQHVYGKSATPPMENPWSVDTTSPRIFHTHIPYQLLSRTLDSFNGRVVYLTRNPKDTLVSMWHFVNKSNFIGNEPWPIEMAVEKFCKGVVSYGPYYDHVLEFKKLSSERPENFLFLTYEELKTDTKSVVRMLANFLGYPTEGEEEVEEIIRGCSFDVLSNYDVNKSEEILGSFDFPNNSFYRKGEIGDHKNALTQEMMEKIDAVTRENFHSAGFMYGI